MTRSLLITSALAATYLLVTPAIRAGDEVAIPKDAPVFKVTMPDGWEAKDAITGLSPELNNRKGLYVNFKKLSKPDGKAATEAEAKDRVEYNNDKKIDEPITEIPDPVAGNKAYSIKVSCVSMPPERDFYQVVGFTVDGKTWYAATFHGMEQVVKESTEEIVAILASIVAAK